MYCGRVRHIKIWGGGGWVGLAAGQLAHQVVGLRVNDVSIGCAGIGQLTQLQHDRGACILAARDGPNFFSLSECSHFGNRPEHLSRGSDLTGFCLGVNDDFDQ